MAEKGYKTCDICGFEIWLSDERTYIARDDTETGLTAAVISKKEPHLFDAIDCPYCGCQKILQPRLRVASIDYFDTVGGGENNVDE